jgi:hypothetical protein
VEGKPVREILYVRNDRFAGTLTLENGLLVEIRADPERDLEPINAVDSRAWPTILRAWLGGVAEAPSRIAPGLVGQLSRARRSANRCGSG